MYLSEINIYPIKSLAGIAVQEWPIDNYGLQYDRKWMLVDDDGIFLSQRSLPKMTHLKTAIKANELKIYSEKLTDKDLFIPLNPSSFQEKVEVTIWKDKVTAWHLSQNYDQWFSQALALNCRLVYMPSETERLVDARFARQKETVGFADDFPFLLIGEGSLEDLNRRLQVPVPMARFRPNFVISGAPPYAEDEWHIINIGENRFEVAKPSARCSVTTVDLQTAQRGKEPLKTLASYRTVGGKVMFGQNLLCKSGKVVKQGDKVAIISAK